MRHMTVLDILRDLQKTLRKDPYPLYRERRQQRKDLNRLISIFNWRKSRANQFADAGAIVVREDNRSTPRPCR